MTRPRFTERFRAVVAERPDAVAVESGTISLTYGELSARASELGECLQTLGARPEWVVGLGLDKSPEYLIAMLGVWFSGAAFMPLDRASPKERLSFLLRDSGAALVIVQGDRREPFAELPVPLVDVEQGPSDIALRTARIQNPALVHAPASEEDLAYVIYTSGSTGAPKGVLVPHRGIVNVLDTQIPAFCLGPKGRALFYLSTSFDASISDIGTALLSGATLCIEPASALETAAGLLEIVRARRITHVDLPPALLRILDPTEAPACLETIIIGGEPCPPAVVRRWAERCRVVNVYGPTEATVCTSLCACSPTTWERPLIGRPIPNVRLHLLDAALHPVPVGTPAELCIAGVGLARGYQNRPELDAAKFVVREGERLYRTGDRVVEHADGEIQFLGRIDRQMKLRGLLVAPEEIEAQLLRHPEVERAAVVKRTIGSMREVLVAFVVPKAANSPSSATLRRHLANALPSWMLPQRCELLEEMPVTTTGKVDLAALERRPLSAPDPHRAPVPPATDDEKLLVDIWQRVLGTDRFGLADDFFELGGDSLGVLEAVAAAEASGLPLSPALMMAHPTIAGIAARLDRAAGARGDAMSCRSLREDAALGPEWRERLRAARARPHSRPRNDAPGVILLTGATGFLGSRLLDELLDRTRARVVCLARAASPAEAKQRCLDAMARRGRAPSAADESRIFGVCGDLAAPRLGLAESDWSRLAAEVDIIYHCAAQVNMLLPYAALRPSNVEGTREVLRLLCEGRRKRLHSASTLSLFVASDRNSGRMEEGDTLEQMEWVYGGYAQSKWAAEYLLRASGGDAGPIAFYRFGLLTGDTTTGYSAPTDFLSMFFRGTASLGCVPENAAAGLKVDVTPVDFAAAAMAHLSLHATAEEGCSTFHIANPRGALVAELIEAMRSAGLPVEEVAEGEWQRRLEARLRGTPSGPASAAYLALCRCLSTLGAFERHRTLDLFQATGAEFGMEHTIAGLQGSGLICPPPSRELLQTYVRASLRF